MRVLFLTNHPAWPQDSGVALRCGLHLETMADEFEVDALFVLLRDIVPDPLVGPDVRARNVTALTVPRSRASVARRGGRCPPCRGPR